MQSRLPLASAVIQAATLFLLLNDNLIHRVRGLPVLAFIGPA
jgi:hypothetical protein